MRLWSKFVPLCLALASCCSATSRAQTPDDKTPPEAQPVNQEPPQELPDDPPVTLFPHSESSRWWISGQGNMVFQWHPSFSAKYSGPNSLTTPAQSATTHILTLYTGFELTHTTEILADLEDATGGGIGTAVGLAGITNLDDVRTVQGVQLSRAPYLARLMLHQIIPLSSDRVPAERGSMSLATSLPARRIEFRIGKFDLTDFFDNNSGGSDSHLQFLNWTVVNNGAWDYAANTRGYTDGAMLEYDDHQWAVRFAEVLMPKVANGIFLDADLARARSENVEAQVSGELLPGRPGILRILVYVNHANMGNYQESIAEFLSGETPQPDITATRVQGRIKAGYGINFEQKLTPEIGVFGRYGWSDGRNESFAYTEDDQTIEFGAWLQGDRWRRKLDKVGLAFVSNGISKYHREYLKLGGLGFLLGDGNLTYGREDIVEAYYDVHLWRGIFGAFDLQHVNNPGYNQDRGPVWVGGLRLHVDF
jgi:high affinity Mn2+ porin